MELFLIIVVFVIVALVTVVSLMPHKENFQTHTPYTKSKFYTYPPTKWEKLNSLYSPIIVRPPEHSGLRYGGRCTDVLYPKSTSPYGKGEMAAPCCPKIEAKYYAMRPILPPQTYNEMLEILFSKITDRVPLDIPKENLRFQDEFCNGECFSDVMKFIMKKINHGKQKVNIFKEYAKNDTWGGEEFAFVHQKVFSFTNYDNSDLTQQQQADLARYGKLPGPKKLIVTFTLHNTLRSTSTNVIATVYSKNNKYYLEKIEFATQKPTNKIKGQSIVGDINLNNAGLPSRNSGPNWLYGNTIENQTFNLKGFHDPNPENNILIPGGIPEEFKDVLQKCDQGYLMQPSNGLDRFKGGPLISSNCATQTNSPVFYQNKKGILDMWKINV